MGVESVKAAEQRALQDGELSTAEAAQIAWSPGFVRNQAEARAVQDLYTRVESGQVDIKPGDSRSRVLGILKPATLPNLPGLAQDAGHVLLLAGLVTAAVIHSRK